MQVLELVGPTKAVQLFGVKLVGVNAKIPASCCFHLLSSRSFCCSTRSRNESLRQFFAGGRRSTGSGLDRRSSLVLP
jgi:hypothetical protein